MTPPNQPDCAEALLRQANPIPEPRRSLPPDHPAVAALREEIIMSETLTRTPPAPSVPQPPTRPSRWIRPAMAIAAAAAVALGVVAVAGGGDSDPQPVAEPPTSPGGPVSSSLSCVEVYSPETLARREIAFDGTVQSVDGDEITFRVGHWYRGGSDDTVTLGGALTLTSQTSAGQPVPLEPGTRMLVAGDGGFAWSCGFTQPYDAGTAASWQADLS
jgi:hypothetical protein